MRLLRALAVLGPLGILQSTLPAAVGLPAHIPNLVAVAALWWTSRRGLDEGWRWALTGGLLIDVLSAGPLGVNLMALVAGVGVAAFARSLLLSEHPLLIVLMVIAGMIAYLLVQSAGLAAAGWQQGSHHLMLAHALEQVVLAAGATLLLWWPLRAVDRWVGHPLAPEF